MPGKRIVLPKLSLEISYCVVRRPPSLPRTQSFRVQPRAKGVATRHYDLMIVDGEQSDGEHMHVDGDKCHGTRDANEIWDFVSAKKLFHDLMCIPFNASALIYLQPLLCQIKQKRQCCR